MFNKWSFLISSATSVLRMSVLLWWWHHNSKGQKNRFENWFLVEFHFLPLVLENNQPPCLYNTRSPWEGDDLIANFCHIKELFVTLNIKHLKRSAWKADKTNTFTHSAHLLWENQADADVVGISVGEDYLYSKQFHKCLFIITGLYGILFQ